MTAFLRISVILSFVLVPLALGWPSAAEAKRIERACMQSDRSAANPPLCRCIQSVADQTLSRSDQRMASKFFKDPQRAQDVRQSDRATHEAFWQRYKAFGQAATAACG